MKTCPYCGVEITKKATYCRKHAKLVSMLGSKPGRKRNKRGYIVLTGPDVVRWALHFNTKVPSTGLKEHTYLMTLKIGRLLEPNEVVHHINKDKCDNRLSNLVIMDKVEHNRMHQEAGDYDEL